MTWADLVLRIRALVFRARVEQELEDELDFHLAMAHRKHAAAGHSEEEAARLARLDFGRFGTTMEECRSVRGLQAFETVLQDVRYAVRSFGRSPGFVLTVEATIALGLGLNTALFTLFNAYVLRPILVHDPHSLYSFTWTSRGGRAHRFSWGEYQQFEKARPAFSEVAAVQYLYTRLDGHPFQGQLVTGNYFQMLGVGAALGRTLLPEDAAAPGGDPVIVLSYQAWQRTFAGRPDIVGTKISLRGFPMQVIGVARQGFQDLSETPRDFWAPLTMAAPLQDGPDLFGPEHPERLDIVGRIQRGQSMSGAEAALAAWSRQMTAELPAERRASGIRLLSKATAIPLTRELLLAFGPLMAAFGLVLLLACTNVANMMLARALARQREIGIRLSLGAGRSRQIRQLLTESVLLSVPAAVLAFGVSQVTIAAGIRAMFATVPRDTLELIHDVSFPPDWRVFGFMLLAALASAFLFGLAPATQATRGDVMLAARGEFTSDLRPVRMRNALVIAQITVCTLLLVACGALVRTTVAMSAFDIGFRTRGVIAMNIAENARTRVVDALASDPGVDTIAAASSFPLSGLLPAVAAVTPNGTAISVSYNYVSPEYFGMLGIPILRGRNFSPAEAASGIPVAILSAAGAQHLFANADSLGQVVHLAGNPARDVRIIGVVADIVSSRVHLGRDAALIYIPATRSAPQRSLLVRVRGDVEAERRRLDMRLGSLAPGALEDMHSLDQHLELSIYPFRAAALIGLAVGGIALLLTVSGIYGVLSYLVTQRTREIGIRVALGATTGTVTALVLKQCLRLAAIGIGLGVPLALGLSRLLASQFLMVFMQVVDVPAISAGVLLVAIASLAAGYIPSRRAARIDPIHTLRYD